MAYKTDHMKRMVRSWCVASGMTYDDLAERLGVPLTTLKSWIYGQNRISVEDAARICDVFGKKLDELIGRMEFAGPGSITIRTRPLEPDPFRKTSRACALEHGLPDEMVG